MPASPAVRKAARHWWRLGITTRLMIGHVVLLTLVFGGIILQSDRVINQRLESALNSDLADEVTEFTDAVELRPPGESLAAFTRQYLPNHSRIHARTLIISLQPSATGGPAGRLTVLVSAGGGALAGTAPVSGWISHPPSRVTLVTLRVNGADYRVVGSPLWIAGREVGTLVASSNLASLNPDRSTQLAQVIAEGLAALTAAVIGGYFLLRRVLKTVHKVTRAADEARRGDFAQRLAYSGPNDEVGRLARTMNQMLSQLDAAFSAQRRLLADVSHQLRTPLTVARGHLEVLARTSDTASAEQSETIALVVDELTQMSLMVERVLLLGQAMEPDFLLEEVVDLPALLEELADAARIMAPRAWSVSQVPAVTVRCDRAKLRGALLNLLDNAVKATGEEDAIKINVIRGEELVIEIADTGRGIPAAEQQVVFDRFQRSREASYGGSGLGFAIVKAVAEGHGGRVELTSLPGQGTTVAVILPASRIGPMPEPAVTGSAW